MVTFAALLSSGANGTFAAEQHGADARLSASDAPALLEPIDRQGRSGWNCAAEHAARARSSDTAELPTKE